MIGIGLKAADTIDTQIFPARLPKTACLYGCYREIRLFRGLKSLK
jgi:hypothetical protein